MAIDDGIFQFRWKDYCQQHRWKTMSLPAHEFMRRFLMHVLPPAADPQPASDYRAEFAALTGRSLLACPHGSSGKMLVVETIPRGGSPPVLQDTS